MSRLKERKRAREKRQRWRKRERKRLQNLIASAEPVVNPACLGIGAGVESLPPPEILERFNMDVTLYGQAAIVPPDFARAGEWMPAWWVGLPKILRAVTWPAVWVHRRYLKWKYPPTYIKSEGD